MNEALAVRGSGNYLDDAFDTDFSQGLLHFRCTSGRCDSLAECAYTQDRCVVWLDRWVSPPEANDVQIFCPLTSQ